MRCVGRVRAFCVTAAVGSSPAIADPALIDTDATPPAESRLSGGASPEKFLYFSGFDCGAAAARSTAACNGAPRGLNEDGFTLKLLLAEGTYRYLAGSTDIRGTGLLASLMPGWRIKRGNFEAKIFAGLDLQNHRLSQDDPGNSLRGNHVGLRVGADFWWEPTSSIMMAASISGSTIGTTFGARGPAGWRVMDRFWAGQELEASGDEVYRQYRIDAHLTSFKIAAFEWPLGAGYVEDNSHRSGLYGRLSLLTRR